MKKQKRSRSKLIMSVALLSSLAMTNIAFASNDLARTSVGTRSQMSQHEVSIAGTSSKSFDRVKRDGKNLKLKKAGKPGNSGPDGKPLPPALFGKSSTTQSSAPRVSREHTAKAATSTRDFAGKITAVNGTSFTIEKRGVPMKHHFGAASTTPQQVATPTFFTVTTSDGTVYMRNGKLDSSVDMTVGTNVIVKGVLDVTTQTVAAKGIHVIDTNAFGKKKTSN